MYQLVPQTQSMHQQGCDIPECFNCTTMSGAHAYKTFFFYIPLLGSNDKMEAQKEEQRSREMKEWNEWGEKRKKEEKGINTRKIQ